MGQEKTDPGEARLGSGCDGLLDRSVTLRAGVLGALDLGRQEHARAGLSRARPEGRDGLHHARLVLVVPRRVDVACPPLSPSGVSALLHRKFRFFFLFRF